MQHSKPTLTLSSASFYVLTCTVLALAGPGAAVAQPQLSGTPDELREFLMPRPNFVNISGEGELTAYKDVARVSLLVTTEARTLSEAMATNQALRQRLISGFVDAGIAETDINNSKFSSSPQFGLFGRSPNSFEVSARMEISANSEQQLQLLAGAADNNEEVKFERTEFEHSLEDDFEDQVRELAMQDVIAQKSYYETRLGFQLQAVNFYYGGINRSPRVMPMAAMQQEMASDTALRSSATTASAPAAAVAPSFDEVKYQTSVTVVYEIVKDD